MGSNFINKSFNLQFRWKIEGHKQWHWTNRHFSYRIFGDYSIGDLKEEIN